MFANIRLGQKETTVSSALAYNTAAKGFIVLAREQFISALIPTLVFITSRPSIFNRLKMGRIKVRLGPIKMKTTLEKCPLILSITGKVKICSIN
jgi:hypothetical protein